MTSAACRRIKTRTNLLLNILLLLQGLLQLSLKVTDLSQVLGRLEQQQKSKRKENIQQSVKEVEIQLCGAT